MVVQDRDYTDFWAEETTLEQTLLLDILFLLYYEPLYSCKAVRLKELLKMFQVSLSNVGWSFSLLPALSSSGQSLQLMKMLFLTLHALVQQVDICVIAVSIFFCCPVRSFCCSS